MLSCPATFFDVLLLFVFEEWLDEVKVDTKVRYGRHLAKENNNLWVGTPLGQPVQM